jgi:S-adenosylmethionine synthetase
VELIVDTLTGLPIEASPLEVVERKGLGHPDSICDSVAEEFGLRLCRFYRDQFGIILHHNVDKALLFGGVARPAFGGGEVIEPMELYLAGRATRTYDGVEVPIERLALDAARDWLGEHFHHLDPERHLRVRCLTRPGSSELVQLFTGGEARANDTSCGVGFAPLSRLEEMVLRVERELNAPAMKRVRPEIGEDVKVMGVREGERFRLTLACAFVDTFVHDAAEYVHKKQRLVERALEIARGSAGGAEVRAEVNAGDDPEAGAVYLTVTGTSAEAGDDGQVGRGNRANGLITPMRPMTLEAVAGKNPVTHVGKLYNLLASRIARAVTAQVEEVTEAVCCLVSQIGQPVNDPALASIEVRTAEGIPTGWVRPTIEEIARAQLEGASELWRELIDASLPIC